MHTAPQHILTQTHAGARATGFIADDASRDQVHSTRSNTLRFASTLALVAALALGMSLGTTQATAQTASTTSAESTLTSGHTHADTDTSSLPQLSDFTPPYTCPWFFGRPASCNIPIKVSLECVDIRTIPANQLSRPFTEETIRKVDQACKLLPLWMDQDPRIVVVDKENSKMHVKYKFITGGSSFVGLRIYFENTSFQIMKGIDQDLRDRASYFVQESLLKMSEEGYLP